MTTTKPLTGREARLELAAAVLAFEAELANVAGLHRLAKRLRARAQRRRTAALVERANTLDDRHA